MERKPEIGCREQLIQQGPAQSRKLGRNQMDDSLTALSPGSSGRDAVGGTWWNQVSRKVATALGHEAGSGGPVSNLPFKFLHVTGRQLRQED